MTSIRLSRAKRYENHHFLLFFLAWREGLSDQDKKDIAFAKELFGNMDAYVQEDPQHQSMAKTGMSEKTTVICRILALGYSTLFSIMA